MFLVPRLHVARHVETPCLLHLLSAGLNPSRIVQRPQCRGFGRQQRVGILTKPWGRVMKCGALRVQTEASLWASVWGQPAPCASSCFSLCLFPAMGMRGGG